jgi:hypothetical protein
MPCIDRPAHRPVSCTAVITTKGTSEPCTHLKENTVRLADFNNVRMPHKRVQVHLVQDRQWDALVDELLYVLDAKVGDLHHQYRTAVFQSPSNIIMQTGEAVSSTAKPVTCSLCPSRRYDVTRR